MGYREACSAGQISMFLLEWIATLNERGLSLDHVIADLERRSHPLAGASGPAGRRWG